MGKVAFVFPGQGSQSVGMAKEFYDNFKESKEIFEKACDILKLDLIKLCFEGPIEELTKTEIAQPAIMTSSITILKVLEKQGKNPDICAGHSLGEYSAYVAANWITFDDGLQAVRERGLAMAGADPDGRGTMAAIMGIDDNEIEKICKEASSSGVVVPANYNCPGQLVVSGDKDGVHKAMEIANEKGAKLVKELVVSGAFHSPLMEGAIGKFKDVVASLNITKGKCPVIANVNADVVNFEGIKESLIKQMTSSVRWTASVQKMMQMGADTFIEVGAGKILQGLIKKVSKEIKSMCVADMKSYEDTISKI